MGYLNKTVVNFLLSLAVKEFENRLIFGEVMSKSLVSCFLTHSVDSNLLSPRERTISCFTAQRCLCTVYENGERKCAENYYK